MKRKKHPEKNMHDFVLILRNILLLSSKTKIMLFLLIYGAYTYYLTLFQYVIIIIHVSDLKVELVMLSTNS